MKKLVLMLVTLCAVTACTENSKADKTMKLMDTCYDDLRFNSRPFSCEDAAKLYHSLNMEKVDTWKRVQLREKEGMIASRMR